MSEQINASKLYDTLNEYFENNGKDGDISFTLAGLTITYDKKDVIGNLIQEWLVAWIKASSFIYTVDHNTQAFPDIRLNLDDPQNDLLEVKSFDKSRSANFDIANFSSYVKSLETHAYRLDADYLIFAYRSNAGKVSIENIWLKKVWELCGPSERWPIKVQYKNGAIVNIRPITWYSNNATFNPFCTRSDFVTAIQETLCAYHPQVRGYGAAWERTVRENYTEWTGNEL